METTVCQAAELIVADTVAESQSTSELLVTLSSTEMSFVGGGCLGVFFG